MKKISVLIPCYNEKENVGPISQAVTGILEKELPQYDYELVFIDNDSTDGTRDIIRGLCQENPRIKAIFNARNFGQFNSPYYGMLQVTGDCVIEMVADFQDPVELIPQYVREWEKGYKIVIGIKTSSQENRVMYWLRSCYYRMIKKLSDPSFGELWRSWDISARRFPMSSQSAARERPTTISISSMMRRCSASLPIPRQGSGWPRSLEASAP